VSDKTSGPSPLFLVFDALKDRNSVLLSAVRNVIDQLVISRIPLGDDSTYPAPEVDDGVGIYVPRLLPTT